MKTSQIPRIFLGLVAALILSSFASAEILKIVVNDTKIGRASCRERV